MSKKKLVILLVVLVVVVAPIIYFKGRPKASAVSYRTSTVSKGTLVASVSGTGNVVVNDSAKINPTITGTVANLKVSLGDTVKKGQRLFTITNDQLDIAVQKSNTAYVQAQQALVNAQAAYSAAKVTYVSQTGSVAKAKALTALEQAKLALVQSEEQLTTDQAALASNTSSSVLAQKVALDQATIATNQDAVDAARTAYDQIKAGTGSSVATARAQLSAAQTAVTAAEQNVTSALADLNNQKETAAERTVTSPIDGTVATLTITNGDTLGSSNSSATTNASAGNSTAPMVIQNLGTLKAVVQVNEVDIANVKVGQKVNMTFDAISGLTLTGQVEKVDTVGTATSGVVSYSATIGFDAIDAKVRPEMSVNAVITTDVKQDVLSVPSTAVKSATDGSSYVQLLVNDAPQNQTVTTGVTNDTETEIVSGLTAGQSVITQTITSTTKTTTNTSTRSIRGGEAGGPTTQVFGGPGFGG